MKIRTALLTACAALMLAGCADAPPEPYDFQNPNDRAAATREPKVTTPDPDPVPVAPPVSVPDSPPYGEDYMIDSMKGFGLIPLYGDAADMTYLAEELCKALEVGVTEQQALDEMTSAGFSLVDAKGTMAIAVVSLCPGAFDSLE